MVRTFRKFVRDALKRCWATLLRVVAPSVSAVAVSPLKQYERELGPSARFKLSSVITSAPAEESPEIRQMLDATRVEFASGVLFQSLEVAGNSGAVIVAHISERGFIEAEHFLAVYPAEDLTPNCEIDSRNRKVDL